MRKIIGLLLAFALLALLPARSDLVGAHLQTRTVGARTEPPTQSAPPFAGVQGAFFALSVSDLEASAKWYADKLGLALDMRTKSDKTSVIVLSGNGLTVELLRHDDATDLGKDALLSHGFIKAGLVVDNLNKTLAELKWGVGAKGDGEAQRRPTSSSRTTSATSSSSSANNSAVSVLY